MSSNLSQRRFLIYAAAISLAGLAALAWQAPRLDWAQWPAMLALGVLALAARRFAFTVGGLVGVSLDTGIHLACAVLLGPAGAAWVAWCSTVAGLLTHPVRRYPWLWPRLFYLGFNGGMFALMQSASSWLYDYLGGPHLAYELVSLNTWRTALAWVLSYHLVNLLIAYPALWIMGRFNRQVIRQTPQVFATEAMMLPVGMLLAVVYAAQGLAGLALLGGLLVVASALLQRLVETGERLRGQLDSAAALTEAGQALAASLDTDKIVELVYHQATKVLNARTFFVALYDEAQQILTFPVLIQEGERRLPARAAFDPGVGLTGHVISTRKSLLLSRATELARLPIQRSPVSGTVPIESVLAVPMLARERVLGVISVQSAARSAFDSDDLAMLTTLAQQAAIAIDNAALVRNLAAQERLRQEMEIARRTQQDLLPAAPPDVRGWDLAGSSSPARTVGGDWFDYQMLEDGQVGIAIGDVSGNGLPAALLMTLTVGLVGAEARRAGALPASRPAQLLARLSASLQPHCARSRLNVAVCYVLLMPDGQVRAANGGGISPLIRRADGRIEWMEACGLPLGIGLEGAASADCEARLESGDALVLITDGWLEAKDERGRMFGFERFEQAVAGAPAATADELQASLLRAIHSFTAPVEPEDDVTIIVCRRVYDRITSNPV